MPVQQERSKQLSEARVNGHAEHDLIGGGECETAYGMRRAATPGV